MTRHNGKTEQSPDLKCAWPDDPVVEEVRAVRAKLWEEGGGTIEGFVELIRKRAAEFKSVGAQLKGNARDPGRQGSAKRKAKR